MPTLSTNTIANLIAPYYPQPAESMLAKLSQYLELLLKWNARTNLTAIRDPQEIVTRHFGESLFAATHVPQTAATLLDLGSGAGFPGIPIQLACPGLQVLLAESQNKKAAFLREAVRTLDLRTQVWAARAETLPPNRVFDVVTLRAVDKPSEALVEATRRLGRGGSLLHLTRQSADASISADPRHTDHSLPDGDSVLRVFRTPMFHVEQNDLV